MADDKVLRVIYIMIATQMKLNQTISTNSASGQFTRLHWLFSIIGIMTAIACSFVLLNDIRHIDITVNNTASISAIIEKVALTTVTDSISILTDY